MARTKEEIVKSLRGGSNSSTSNQSRGTRSKDEIRNSLVTGTSSYKNFTSTVRKDYENAYDSTDYSKFRKAQTNLNAYSAMYGNTMSSADKNYSDNLAKWYGSMSNFYDTADPKALEWAYNHMGMTYDQVKEAKKTASEDDLKYFNQYGKLVGYNSLEDYDAEIADIGDYPWYVNKGAQLSLSASNKVRSLLGQEPIDSSVTSYVDSVVDSKAQKKELEKARELYRISHTFDKYASLMDEEDFEENSKYKGTGVKQSSLTSAQNNGASVISGAANNEGTSLFAGGLAQGINKRLAKNGYTNTAFTEDTYDRLNNNYYDNLSGASDLAYNAYRSMNEEELKVFNYLYNRNPEEAQEYLNDMNDVWERRRANDQAIAVDEFSKQGLLANVALTAGRIAVQPSANINSAMNIVGGVVGGEYNPYSTSALLQNFSTAAESSVGQRLTETTGNPKALENIGVDLPSFLYGTGLSMADSWIGGRVFGPAYSVLMGAGAFQSTAKQLADQGASSQDIWVTAGVAGAAEVITEYISLDKLEDIIKDKSIASKNQIVKYALRQLGYEGSEEVASEVINFIADELYNGGASEMSKKIKEYMEQGMTEEEARKQAAIEFGIQVAEAFAGGAISGGLMGGGEASIRYAENKSDGKFLKSNNNLDYLDQAARLIDKDSDAYKNYMKLVGGEDGTIKDKPSAKIATTYTAVSEQIMKELSDAQVSDTENFLKTMGIKENTADVAKAIQQFIANGYSTKGMSKESVKLLASEKVSDLVKKIQDGKILYELPNSKAKAALLKTLRKTLDKRSILQDMADANVEGDTVVAENPDGTTTVYKAGSLSEEEVKAVQEASNYTDEGKKLFLSTYNEKYGADIHSEAFDTIWSGAMEGTKVETYRSNPALVSIFGEANIDKIYNAASHAIIENARIASQKSEEFANAVKKEHFKSGTFSHEGIEYKNLPSQKRMLYKTAEAFSVLGINVNLIDDAGDSSKNGEFNKETQSITLNLSARYGVEHISGEGSKYFVQVTSHELTHWMKYYSPETFAQLKDLVKKALIDIKTDTGNMWDDSIDREYKAALERGLSEDEAIAVAEEEVVARACEDMLNDNQQMIDMLSQAETGTLNEIKKAIKKFFETFRSLIKKLLNGYKSNSVEAKALRELDNKAAELQKAWNECFIAALSNAHINDVVLGSEARQQMNDIEEAVGENGTVETNEYGEMTMATTEDGNTAMFNLKTIEGTEKNIRKLLKERGADDEEITRVINVLKEQADYLTRLAAEYEYEKMDETLNQELVINPRTGESILRAFVKNGEYPINIDFSTVCKKREAYMQVIEKLIEDGTFDTVAINGSSIAHINEILKEHGFETACLGCFVESRRLQIQEWAQTFCEEWNTVVREYADSKKKKVTPFNFKTQSGTTFNNMTKEEKADFIVQLDAAKKNDKGEYNQGTGAITTKMRRMIKALPALAHTLEPNDLLNANSLQALREYRELYSLVLGRYGSNTPKPVQEFNPYNGEISDLSNEFISKIFGDGIKGLAAYTNQAKEALASENVEFTEQPPKKNKSISEEEYNKLKAEYDKRKEEYEAKLEQKKIQLYLYDIGGVRLQSFSDFLIENTLDYFQMVAELSGKKLPMHSYSKEIVYARIFGMTGIKINMSLIADVDTTVLDDFIGLTKTENGYDYIWGDFQRNQLTYKMAKREALDLGMNEEEADKYAKQHASYIQSIGYKDAVALQLDPRYSSNVGTIAVGISMGHIVKMLIDPNIRMVIPYHSSGMNHEFAMIMHIDKYTDFEKVQNTMIEGFYNKNGKRLSDTTTGKDSSIGKAVNKKYTDYAFDHAIQTMSPQEAAKDYVRWCNELHPTNKPGVYAKYTPKFDVKIPAEVKQAFGLDESIQSLTDMDEYYKVLEDFNVYDSVTGEEAKQQAVTMTYADKNHMLNDQQLTEYADRLKNTGLFTDDEIKKYVAKASMTYEETIRNEVKNRAQYHKTQDAEMPAAMKEIEDTLYSDYFRDPKEAEEARRIKAEKKAIDDAKKKAKKEAEKAQKEAEKNVVNNEKIAYHAGDLGKAEPYSSQSYGRGTGHFGTGTYFVGNIERIKGYNDRDGKESPKESVDFSNYNLYKPYNYDEGKRLHQALKVLDGDIIKKDWIQHAANDELSVINKFGWHDLLKEKYGETYDLDMGISLVNPEAYEGSNYTDTIKEYADSIGVKYDSFEEWKDSLSQESYDWYKERDLFEDYYKDYLKETIEEYADEENKAYKLFLDAYRDLYFTAAWNKDINKAMNITADYVESMKDKRGNTADSTATVFMKALGYEGVDVTHIDGLDNTAYGSVIYDLKGKDLERKQEIGTARFNEKVKSSDVLKQNERLTRENQRLQDDLEKLGEIIKLQGIVPMSKLIDGKTLDIAAENILQVTGSTYSKQDLSQMLKQIYIKAIQMNNEKSKSYLEWESIRGMLEAAAAEVVGKSDSKVQKEIYYRNLLKKLQSSHANLDADTKEFLNGMITYDKRGKSLEQLWQNWSKEYPEIFDKDTAIADMPLRYMDIYESIQEASKAVDEFAETERIRDVAQTIYEKIWNVATFKNVNEAHNAEIKELKAQHRKEMADLRKSKNEAREAMYQKTKAHYMSIINDIREKRNADIKALKNTYKARKANEAARKERNKYVARIEKNCKMIMDWMNENSDKHHVIEPLKEPVAQFISSIDFASKTLLGFEGMPNKGKYTRKDASMARALSGLKDLVIASNRAQVEGNYEIDLPESILDAINDVEYGMAALMKQSRDTDEATQEDIEAGNTMVQINPGSLLYDDDALILRQLDGASLVALDNLVTSLKTVIIDSNKLIGAQQKVKVETVGKKIIDYMKELPKKTSESNTISRLLTSQQILPVYFFDHLGEGGQYIFSELMDGLDEYSRKKEYIKRFANETYTEKEVKKWGKTIHDLAIKQPLTPEDIKAGKQPKVVHIQATTLQLMSLYELSKREQAAQHIEGGGIRFTGFKDGWKTRTSSESVMITDDELERIVNQELDQHEKDVADALQNFMSTTCAAWGNEVTMRRFGIKGFTEENYFPIIVDDSKMSRGTEENRQSIYALLNMGFTKKLMRNADNGIVVDDIISVFAQHSADMAKYNTMALPVLDLVKIYNYKEKTKTSGKQFIETGVKSSMMDALGKDALTYVNNFLRDLNGTTETQRDIGLVDKLIKGYKSAAVGANIQVALLQPISYWRAMYKIDSKYLLKGLTQKPQIKKMRETCPIGAWKQDSLYDMDIARTIEQKIKHDETLRDKIIEGSMKLAEWGDSHTWGLLYNACEAEAKDKGYQVGTKECDKYINERFRDIIYHTQVVDSVMTRSDIMRSKSKFAKLNTAFMSEPTVSYNMVADNFIMYNQDYQKAIKRGLSKKAAAAEAFKKNGRSFARAAMAYTICTAVEAALRASIQLVRQPDDDKELGEEFLQNLIEQFVNEINPLMKIPVFKEFWQNIFSSKTVSKDSKLNDYPVAKMFYEALFSGYSSSRTEYEALANTRKAIDNWGKVINGDGSVYKATYNTLKAASQISGIPASTPFRDVVAMWNLIVGEQYPDIKFE